MRSATLILVAMTMAACVQTVTGPDGQPAYVTRCSGGGCYQTAAKTCPSGYDIFDDHSVIIGTLYQGTGVTNTLRDIAFTCRQPETALR